MDQLAFAVANLGDDAGDLADQGGRINRGHGADGVQVDPDAACFRGGHVQGDGATGSASSPPPPAAAGAWRWCMTHQKSRANSKRMTTQTRMRIPPERLGGGN